MSYFLFPKQNMLLLLLTTLEILLSALLSLPIVMKALWLTIFQDKLGHLSNIEVAMKTTSHYRFSLYSGLTDNDFNISIYNSYQVKSYRGAYNNKKQKNDVIDFIIITDYLRAFGSKESKLPVENLLSLKQLTHFRSNIVDNASALKIQVIGLCGKVFPEYKNLFLCLWFHF